MQAARDGHPEAQASLAQLFRWYWYPLFAHLRGKGHSREQAEDLLQAFFVHVVEKRALGRADPLKGSFRGFLIGCLKYFLANQRELTAAYKRGGQARIISFDAEEAELRMLHDTQMDPAGDVERAFDRRWASLLMERTLAELQRRMPTGRRCSRRSRASSPQRTRRATRTSPHSWTCPVPFVKTTVHRMRRELRQS